MEMTMKPSDNKLQDNFAFKYNEQLGQDQDKTEQKVDSQHA